MRAPSRATCSGSRGSHTRTRSRPRSIRCTKRPAAPARRSRRRRRPYLALGLYSFALAGEPGRVAQRIRLVGLLPREVVVLAAEVAVGRRLLVDRPMEV